jgi:hypothetical protein
MRSASFCENTKAMPRLLYLVINDQVVVKYEVISGGSDSTICYDTLSAFA